MKRRTITNTLINNFQRYLYEEEKSRLTIEKHMHDLRCFAAFAQGRPVDKTLTLAYKSELALRYKFTSANSMIAALNAFLRFAGWHDCCVKQFKVQKKTFCSEESELSKAEYITLTKTAERKCDERLSLLLQTLCGTGIRVSEMPFITVEAARKGEAIVSCKGKARKVFIISALQKNFFATQRRIASVRVRFS